MKWGGGGNALKSPEGGEATPFTDRELETLCACKFFYFSLNYMIFAWELIGTFNLEWSVWGWCSLNSCATFKFKVSAFMQQHRAIKFIYHIN